MISFEENCLDFGRFLRRQREKRDLTLEDFGRLIARSKSTVDRWERNLVPQMHVREVEQVGILLGLSEPEIAALVASYLCTLLTSVGGFR
jgi:transcriptional regulator with XRE-family HTH domain